MNPPAIESAVQTTPPMISAAVMPVVPLSPTLTNTSDERISVISVMPDTGFVPTMAMALAATVVKRNAMTKTIRMAVTDCTQPSSSPKWKNMKTEMSVAIRIVRIRFIVRSRCVRSTAAGAVLLPPPSSDTASPTAWRMIFDCLTMPMMPAMAMPPMPSGLPMKAKRFSAVKMLPGSARMSARVTPSSEASAAGSIVSASDPTSGTTRNHTRHEPAVMIMAYFNPMM